MAMEPMITTKKALMWICVYPADGNTNNWGKPVNILYLSTILAFQCSGLGFSIACFMKYWSIDLEKSLYSPIQIATTLSSVYSLCIAVLLRDKILIMFNNLTKIYRASKWFYSILHRYNIIFIFVLFMVWSIQTLMMIHFLLWSRQTTKWNKFGNYFSNLYLLCFRPTCSYYLRHRFYWVIYWLEILI